MTAANPSIVVVESPAKAKTIEKFLGEGFRVVASFGHIRDLPKSKLGIDIEHNFEPQYIIPKGSGKQVNLLKKALAAAPAIYLATDYDREGEAIAWHILQAAPPEKDQQVHRITFTEITEQAIKNAIKQPRDINQSLVDAQQARRVLDRLVGYSLSPVLWQKIRRGLSAGRVQSVALKLIVDREREILAFVAEEYWSLEAQLANGGGEEFVAKLSKMAGNKAELSNQKVVDELLQRLESASFKVASTDSKEVKRTPTPPFITSSLQQEASRRFGYSAKKTMMIAQQLYEGVDVGGGNIGLITYMRTDSYTLSQSAITDARDQIAKTYGKQYLPSQPRVYKKKVRGAQEAHEAIRPTSFMRRPDQIERYLSKDQARLYQLVWQRAIASQMQDARYLQRGADITAADCTFRATGRQTVFDGFTKVYFEQKEDQAEDKDNSLPELKEGEALKLGQLLPEQHFTSPPPRYTEASLIKKLEENGIGRPSTYAPTISTIVSRGYVVIENRQLAPQEIGFMVTDLLTAHFPFVVSEDFTADMEEKLDDIAEGQTKWQPVIRDFYQPFAKQLESEKDKIERVKFEDKPTDEKCDVCGKPMVIKHGRFGEFMACTGWPDCKNTKPIIKKIGALCPEDGGELVERKTKKGRTFYGCSNYPKCKYATWTKPKTAQAA